MDSLNEIKDTPEEADKKKRASFWDTLPRLKRSLTIASHLKYLYYESRFALKCYTKIRKKTSIVLIVSALYDVLFVPAHERTLSFSQCQQQGLPGFIPLKYTLVKGEKPSVIQMWNSVQIWPKTTLRDDR